MVKVYTLLEVINSPEYHTKYVRHEDYAALEAELRQMTESRNDWRDIAQRKELALKHGA